MMIEVTYVEYYLWHIGDHANTWEGHWTVHDSPTASGCEGETDEHNKEHNEDEDGGGADSTSKAKGKERATEGTCSLNWPR